MLITSVIPMYLKNFRDHSHYLIIHVAQTSTIPVNTTISSRVDTASQSDITYKIASADSSHVGRYFCSASCSAAATYSKRTSIKEVISITETEDQPAEG